MLTLFHGFLLYLFSPLDISHFQEQNDLKGLLDNLHQNIQAKKRKNVEIMWLAATVSTASVFSLHTPSKPWQGRAAGSEAVPWSLGFILHYPANKASLLCWSSFR